MCPLQLTLLGSPVISIDGVPFNSRVDKAVALVALLALQGPTLHRDTLIAHLWTGSETNKSRTAFRTIIWRLKSTPLSPWLEIERESVTLNTDSSIWIDTKEFREKLEKTREHSHSPDIACPACFPMLNRAIELYRGDFMAGYSPRNAAGFDEWRSEYGSILHNDYLETLERLGKGYFQHAQYSQALQVIRRWLVIDQFNEEAHSLMMRSYASSNQRANAIAHYRSYQRLVEKQLYIDPAEELTALYNHLLSGNSLPVTKFEPLKQPVMILMDVSNTPELWTRHGKAVEPILSRFNGIIKDGLRRCGGRIIKQSPENFLIYFDQGQPLMCAITIFHQVAETSWGLPDPLSIRMVVTTIPRNQTSYPENSPELQSCQQLLQSASSNQILITEQAIGSLEFPSTSQARTLGSYIIPGQLNPMLVYELVHPQLPAVNQTGLRNLVRSPSNLPIQFTRFVGRENELKSIAYLLSQPETRLLTLLGPGGIGKTRLAIEAINRLLATYSHEIYYVPLAIHRSPSSIHLLIAEALNLVFNNLEDQVVQLIDQIKHRRMLLLLDNFEHILPAAPFLVTLLEGAPGLRIILTSRERVNLHLETIFEVQGLPFPEQSNAPDFDQYPAIELFVQNARRVSPRFTPHAHDKRAILRICREVEGFPLGIELASAWVRTFTCQEIADEIQKDLDFLHTSSPDVPERHRSLRAAFDHSWRLLSEESRRTIGKLAVFRNGFSLPAAEIVANATPNMLASYVDKSILIRQSTGRFLIPETLRVYVLERVKSEPEEFENLLDAYSDYFSQYTINMMAKFASQQGGEAIKEIMLEAENIRSALNRTMDRCRWDIIAKTIDPLMSYFEIQGRFREGLDIARSIMVRMNELVGIQQPRIYHNLLGWDGWFSFQLGFTQEGLEKMHARLDFAKRQGDILTSTYLLMRLADAHNRLGEFNTALEEIEQCLETAKHVWTPDVPFLIGVRGYAYSIYGLTLIRLHRNEDARQALNQSNADLVASGGRYGLIRLLDVKARLAKVEGKYEESKILRLQALEIATEFNDRRSMAAIMNNLGESFEHLGDLQTALSYTYRTQQLSDEIGDRQLLAVSNNNLGYLTLRLNHPASEAIPYYEKSLAMFRLLGDTYGIFFTLRDIARAWLLAECVNPARAYLTEALRLGSNLNNPLLVLHLLTVAARLEVHRGHSDRAIQLCTMVLRHPQSEVPAQQEAMFLLAELQERTPTEDSGTPGENPPTLPTFTALLTDIDS